jgi:hypothetical protein
MIAFGATCWAVGDFFRERFFHENFKLSAIARHTLAFTTGNVAISYLLTALGFIGAFVSPVLWAVFLTGIGITILRIVGECRRTPSLRSVNQTIQEEMDKGIAKERRKREAAPIFLMVILGLFFLPAILQAAAPPYVRDSLVYHLLCPKEYLKAGRLLHIDGNIFSAFPKGHEVLMTLLLAISGDRTAQGFSIVQQLAAVGSVYSLAHLMSGSWTAVLCTLGYATVPPVIYFSGCGYVEPALLMTLAGSLLVFVLSLRRGKETVIAEGTGLRPISLLGFLAGWMPALKYSGLIYLGLIGLVLLWGQRRVSPKKALRVIGAFTFAATPGLCWMLWNWIDFGNPVYPMGWFLFGGKGWDEARALAMSQYFDVYGMGRNLLDYLVLPWRLAFLGRFDTIRFDGAMGPFLILAVILAAASVILLLRRRLVESMVKEIGLMFVVSTTFFMFGTQQVRFWVPSQMLACAFVAPAVGWLVASVRNRRMLKMVLILTVIGSLAWNIWFLGAQFLKIGYYRPVLGMEQERTFLIQKVPGYPALEFINQNLSEHSRILCVWTGAYGYYINRSYYSDTFIEDVTLKGFIKASTNGKELSQRLAEAGFTHLFFRLSVLVKNMRPEQQAIFVDFLRKGAVELFSYQDYSLLKIKEEKKLGLE